MMGNIRMPISPFAPHTNRDYKKKGMIHDEK